MSTLLTMPLIVLQAAAPAELGDPLPSLEQLLPAGGTSTSSSMIQVFLLLTILGVGSSLVVMVTCFTRFIIALSFLRTGLGLQTTPPNMILVGLALFMTLFVMSPTFSAAWQDGVGPLIDGKIGHKEAFDRSARPFKDFMRKNVRPKDLQLFVDLAEKAGTVPAEGAESDLRVLVPAFMISEIRRGFEIGFLLILPMLVIDLVVATLTMSMGMMMMPPSVIALPFKILFFVLIDGWNLVVGSLVRSFG